jgi:hypothetical protein
MKLSHLPLAACLAAAALAARAGDDGYRALESTGTMTRAEVLQQLADYKRAGVNPHASSYNPLKDFRSERTRAEVQADYLAGAQEAAAMNGEDSGSAWLAAHKGSTFGTRLAGVTPFAMQ